MGARQLLALLCVAHDTRASVLNAFQQTDAQRCDAELSSAERRAIIDRVERFSPQELRQCEKWVHRSRSSYLHALKIKRAGGAYATEQLAEAKRCSVPHADGEPPGGRATYDGARVHVPTDSLDLCHVIEFLIAHGAMADPARARGELTMADVGAAFGGELLIGHRLGFRVVSFEAMRPEFDQLNASWARLAPRVRLVHAAVSNASAGAMRMFAAGDSSSFHAGAVAGRLEQGKMPDELGARVVEVAVTSLDAELRGRAALVRVDVQGHEYEVLLGALGTLRCARPALYFEYRKKYRGADSPRVLCLARELGYECVFRGAVVVCTHREQTAVRASGLRPAQIASVVAVLVLAVAGCLRRRKRGRAVKRRTTPHHQRSLVA